MTLQSIQQAAERIRDSIYLSPFIRSDKFSHQTGNSIFFKLENLQMTGAFKERGALNKILLLTRGGEAPRRDRRIGRKPRAGRGLPRYQARHHSANLHAADNAARQGVCNARIWRSGDTGRRQLRRDMRGSNPALQGARTDVHSSVRRRGGDRGAGNSRNRNARSTTRISMRW